MKRLFLAVFFASSFATSLVAPHAAASLNPGDASRVDRVAGVPVVVGTLFAQDGFTAADGYTDGQTVFLRPGIYGRLSLGAVRFGCCSAWPIFVLAHELGHVHDPWTGPVERVEDRANDFASSHFCGIARDLGASPARVRQLTRGLPPSRTSCR